MNRSNKKTDKDNKSASNTTTGATPTTQTQYKKIQKSFLTVNKFLLLSSILLILSLFLFDAQITSYLSTTTPIFYAKYYYPLQSQFSKLRSTTATKYEHEKQQIKQSAKEKGEQFKENIKEKTNRVVEEAKEKSKEFKENIKEKSENIKEGVKEQYENIKEGLKEQPENIKQQSEYLKEQAIGKGQNIKEQAMEKGEEIRDKSEYLKEHSKEKGEEIRDKSEHLKDQAMGKSQNIKEQAMEKGEETKEQLKEGYEKARKGQESKGEIKEKGEEKIPSKEELKEKLYEVKEEIQEKGENILKSIKSKLNLLNEFDYSNLLGDIGGKKQKIISLSGLNDGKWSNFQYGSFVAEQGILSFEEGFLRIDSNPYVSTVESSLLDHLKYMIFSNDHYSIPEQGSLFVNFTVRGEAFGNSKHPFPKELVQDDIESEFRFASAALNVLDFKTSVVADFIITNSKVYALYERLPFSKHIYGDYASFIIISPVFDLNENNAKGKFIDYSIEYNKLDKTICWYVNGIKLFTIDRVGFIPNIQELKEQGGSIVMSQGGKEQDIYPNEIQVGCGTISILDAVMPSKEMGLVRLESKDVKYYNPSDLQQELKFYDEESLTQNRIFGQGFVLDIKKISVSTKE